MVCLICESTDWELNELPCKHQYCQFCLEQMTEANETVSCPICREDWFSPPELLHKLISDNNVKEVRRYCSLTSYFPLQQGTKISALEHSLDKGFTDITLELVEKVPSLAASGMNYLLDKGMADSPLMKQLQERLLSEDKTKVYKHIAATDSKIGYALFQDEFSQETCLLMLQISAQHGSINVLDKLLESGLHIDCLVEGKTPLMYSAQQESTLEMTKRLLDFHSADPLQATGSQGLTALDIASANGAVKTLDLLAFTLSNNKNALHQAVAHEQTESIAWLASKGYDLNTRNNKGETALFLAKTEKIGSMLLDLGANLHAIDKSGKSLLHYYVENTNLKMTKWYLKAGGKQLPDYSWTTPLHIAISKLPETTVNTTAFLDNQETSDEEVLEDMQDFFDKLLADAFASSDDVVDDADAESLFDVLLPIEDDNNASEKTIESSFDASDKTIESSFDASDKTTESSLDESEDEDLISTDEEDMLSSDSEDYIEYDADFEEEEDFFSEDESFFEQPVESDTMGEYTMTLHQLLQSLLGPREDIWTETAKQEEQETAFEGDYNAEQIARLLLKAGSDVNAQDRQGNSAGHILALNGNSGFIELLAKKGADFNLENHKGVTPFELVCESKDKGRAKLLIGCGAANTYTNRGSTLLTKLLKEEENYEFLKFLLENGLRLCPEPITSRTELHIFSETRGVRTLLLPFAKQILDHENTWGKRFDD
jgi:ankyrin repeat protein